MALEESFAYIGDLLHGRAGANYDQMTRDLGAVGPLLNIRDAEAAAHRSSDCALRALRLESAGKHLAGKSAAPCDADGGLRRGGDPRGRERTAVWTTAVEHEPPG